MATTTRSPRESPARSPLMSWTTVIPVLALVALALTWGRDLGGVLVAVVAVVLAGAVLAAVHRAEVVAHRVGEPFGSLVLAVAVTIIEVALIVTLMASGGPGSESLARDTVFAAVMITCNGIVGIAFAALASLVLYGTFVLTQTVRHRDFFLPVTSEGAVLIEEHADPPTNRAAAISPGLLLVALVAVAGLAKVESPAIEASGDAAGFPRSFVGVVIALLVLLPETLAAVRAAQRNRIQISLNLAFGSAMASIGLTIPVIALATIWLDGPLELGLGATQMVLLALTIVVGVLTVVPGRATRLQGDVHLVLLAAFVFLAVNP